MKKTTTPCTLTLDDELTAYVNYIYDMDDIGVTTLNIYQIVHSYDGDLGEWQDEMQDNFDEMVDNAVQHVCKYYFEIARPTKETRQTLHDYIAKIYLTRVEEECGCKLQLK